VRVLLDTQILIWVATDDPRLSPAIRTLIHDAETKVVFSVVSLWEITIKAALDRSDFRHTALSIRVGALQADWEELGIIGEHALAVANLPAIHGDPFDRLLVAQARVEGMTLLSADRTLWRYGDPVHRV
jgi:PIN domain nuclease of toxin-antitoxin system